MKNNYLLLLLLLISQISISQTKEKIITGKVTADQASVQDVEVVNLSTEKTVRTNANGEFSISAKVNDVIIFSNFTLDYKRKTITKTDYDKGRIEVVMTPKITELEEVTVSKDGSITAESLGFEEAKKKYTPAERKLKTASTPARLNQGLEISNDAIINGISGKTKTLKKEVEVEKKESYMERLDEIYPDDYYRESLSIPKADVKGFKYYAIHDSKFAKLLEANNTLDMEIVLADLALKYKKILADEK